MNDYSRQSIMNLKHVFLVFFELCILSRNVNVLALENEGIVGADVSELGRFPYQVSIQQYNKHACGGAILDSLHVVTAAHCVVLAKTHSLLRGTVRVVGGVNDLNSHSSTRESSEVIAIYVPNDYHDYYRFDWSGDIAILKLKQALNVGANPFIDYLSLPRESDDFHGKMAVVTGFGANDVKFIRDLDTNKVLRQTHSDGKVRYANALVFHNKRCSYLMKYQVPSSRLCARITQYENAVVRGVCSADSGSPLVINNVLIGVVSTGSPGCDEADIPTMYTKVTYYLDFIKKALRDNPDPKTMIMYNLQSP